MTKYYLTFIFAYLLSLNLTAQSFQAKMLTRIPYMVPAAHVAADGSFTIMSSFKSDTIIGGDSLKSTLDNATPWYFRINNNKARIRYAANGKAISAKKLDSSLYKGARILYLHKNGDLSRIFLKSGSDSYYYSREDSLGNILQYRLLFSGASPMSFTMDEIDDKRFSVAVVPYFSIWDFKINTAKGLQIQKAPDDDSYYYHYILMCNQKAEVEDCFFAYAETNEIQLTTNRTDQFKKNLHQRGDSIWYNESTFTKPGFMLQNNLVFDDDGTAYQGVLINFYKSKMLSYNLHHIQYPNDTSRHNFHNLQAIHFTTLNAKKNQFISITMSNMSGFNAHHLDSIAWVSKYDSLNGNLLPVNHNPHRTPWIASSGLLYALCIAEYRYPELYPKSFTERFANNDLLLACYNPDNGKLVELSKVASNISCFDDNVILGEDSLGNLLIYMQACNNWGFDTFKVNDTEYPASEYYIIKMELQKPTVKGVNLSPINCYNSVATIETKGLVQADKIEVNWGDGRKSNCTNCYYLKHKYAYSGEYTAKINVTNDGIKTYFEETAILPNLYHVLPFDTVYIKKDSSLSINKVNGINYKWSTGETGNTVSLKDYGIYHLTTTFGDCQSTDSFYVLPDYSNVKSAISKVKVKLFPIPANDQLSFSVSNLQNPYSVSISDVSGTVVYQKNIENSSSNSVQEIDIQNLEAGLYLFTVSHNGQSSSSKLVIAKYKQ